MEENNQETIQEETKVEITQEETKVDKKTERTEIYRELSKELGINAFNPQELKQKFQELHEYEESKKSELEKLQEKTMTLETTLKSKDDEYSNKINEYESKILGYELGIKNESLNEAITLAKLYANDQKDLKTALQEVTEKYPMFKQQKTIVRIGEQTNDTIQSTGGKSPILEAFYKKRK